MTKISMVENAKATACKLVGASIFVEAVISGRWRDKIESIRRTYQMTMEQTKNDKKFSYEESVQRTLSIIADLLRNIKYGNIQITIQECRVVQIDKTQKFRLNDQKSKLTIKTDKQLH